MRTYRSVKPLPFEAVQLRESADIKTGTRGPSSTPMPATGSCLGRTVSTIVARMRISKPLLNQSRRSRKWEGQAKTVDAETYSTFAFGILSNGFVGGWCLTKSLRLD